MKKIFLVLTTFMYFSALLSAQSFMDEEFFSTKEASYEDLLKGFSASDNSLERMKIKMEAAEISSEQ